MERIKIGDFDENGEPINWEFDCFWTVPVIEIKENGQTFWGGYSVAELREIKKKSIT